jgi:hypothetical protein
VMNALNERACAIADADHSQFDFLHLVPGDAH